MQVILKDAEDQSRNYTLRQLKKEALSFGAGLQIKEGIEKGDVVAIVSPNDIEVVPIAFGVLSIGGIVSPMNPTYTTEELSFQLSNSSTKVIVAHFSAIETVKRVCIEIGLPQSRILVLGVAANSNHGLAHWKTLKANVDDDIFRTPNISPKSDIAALMFSSGTTGTPKAVMLTHYNLTSNLLQRIVGDLGVVTRGPGIGKVPNIPDAPPSGDTSLMMVPFFHIFGFAFVSLTNIYLGIPTVFMAKYEFTRWCEIVQEEKITLAPIVPTIANQLIKDPRTSQYNLSSIRMLSVGGSVVSRELVQALFDRTGIPSRGGYGMTEAGPGIAFKLFSSWRNDMSSNGPLLPNLQAKFLPVEDESDPGNVGRDEVLPGQPGELYIRGPGIFKGYWKNQRQTDEALDSDGWLRTGDVGYLDEQGKLFITDRVKELIKYKGFQVPPAELEGILQAHGLVDDNVVVGVWSESMATEIPVAYVVRKGGLREVVPGDDLAIMKWLSTKVVRYKHLKGLKFLHSIPRNTNGKILRRVVREMAKKDFTGNQELQAKL